MDGVEPAAAHRRQECRALDQRVAGERVQAPLGGAGAGVVRAPDPLQERRDAAGRADLAHELDRADVDAELERRGGDERLQVPGPQPGLDPVAPLLREAAVVGGHDVVAEALAEQVREPLGEPAGVDEHQRGAVLLHERGDAVEHVGHLLGRGDGLELAVGQLQREVEVAEVTGVDDLGQGPVADEEPRHRLDRPLRGREADARRPLLAQRLQALEREGEVRAPLVARDRVDLVDDDGLDRAERVAPLLAGDEQIEGLGGGDDEAGWVPKHRRPLRRRGVAGAHRDADRRARRGRARARPPRSRAAGARGSRRCRRRAP